MNSTRILTARRSVPALAVAATVLLALPGTAMAATHASKPSKGGGGGGGSASTTGNDISYPQCGGTYPSGQAFGIVGLNDGTANTWNPCFSSELTWAAGSSGAAGQLKAQIYLNTADPGPSYNGQKVADWPLSGTNGYGTCHGSDSPACAWQYGYNLATADMAKVSNPGAYAWWLDVETANTWQGGTAAALDLNTEVLQGMEQVFTDANLQAGVYSTSYQWGVITGGNTVDLAGVPDWVPGARTERGAQSNCGSAPFTGGASKVELTQWTTTYDNDYSCYVP